ncbi:hypothetical protein C8R47DRAFT_168359 [Mycena vitilis]|nr:hypothetical protein C8R47DRAFT_434120 [Mycena vitilis]KAJ6457843.1 hypothetical protein C8R47DRAFT_168359 [Mycena vitilis]
MPNTDPSSFATQKPDAEVKPPMPPGRDAHPEEESEPAEATADSTEETPAQGQDTDSDAESDFFESEYASETDSDLYNTDDELGFESESGSFTVSIGCNSPVDAEQRAGGFEFVGRNSNMPEGSRRHAIGTIEADAMAERHVYLEEVWRRLGEEIRAMEEHTAEFRKTDDELGFESIGCHFPVDAEQRAGGLEFVGRNSNMPGGSRRHTIGTIEADAVAERHVCLKEVWRRFEEEIRAMK